MTNSKVGSDVACSVSGSEISGSVADNSLVMEACSTSSEISVFFLELSDV